LPVMSTAESPLALPQLASMTLNDENEKH